MNVVQTVVCWGVCGLLLATSEVMAQQRVQLSGPQPARRTGGATKEIVKIRDLEGVGPRGKVSTPVYRSDTSESSVKAKEWQRLACTYDTEEEWIDELSFRYYALLKPKTGRDFLLLSRTVTYLDVEEGKRHVSTVFIRPNTLARHGEVEAVAVEVLHGGEVIATASEPQYKTSQPWWKDQRLSVKSGLLLSRAQTPFAYINYDRYETIKP